MTTRNIGDFGVEHSDFVALTFNYFGQTLRVHPDAGELSYLDFMAKAMEVDDANEAEGVKVTMDFLRQQVHPDDWKSFWTLALANRQKLEDLMKLSKAIVEETTGFPTTPQSVSTPTPPATVKRSRAGSSRQAKLRAIESAAPTDAQSSKAVAAAAMVKLGGRPDLQRAVQLATTGAAL